MTDCPFCARAAAGDGLTAQNAAAVAFPDGFPVGDGHLLVVPHRHVGRVEELDRAEWSELFALVHELAAGITRDPSVDGLNIGVNSGAPAGQTVEHAHVHLIPRRLGDVEDPRGGVRWVIPDRADY